MPGQPSFRRVLISRVLLISVPILLIGVAVTFRKARASLLQTANDNLIESASQKAESIHSTIQDLRLVLNTASQIRGLQLNDADVTQQVLDGLQQEIGQSVQCLQLNAAQTGRVIASTCPDHPLNYRNVTGDIWPSQAAEGITAFQAEIRMIEPFVTPPDESAALSLPPSTVSTNLRAVVQVPVYSPDGLLQGTLTAETALLPPESDEPRSFLGNTVVADLDRQILAHPSDYATIQLNPDSLIPVIEDTKLGKENFRHLFGFSPDEQEWIAGYVPLTLQSSPNETRTYAIIALTPLHDALQGLDEITQTLLWVMAGLLGANLLALLYLAKDLAEPIEQLGQYALRVHQKDSLEQLGASFKIHELNNLARALDLMMRRLDERATELETAWQEAEAANQLKSEFLANTSHELRTPLNAIIGCVRLIRDGCCDSEEEELEFLDRAFEAATHLLKIINDLLDIAKIEAGTLSMALERVNVQTLLREVIDMQQMDIEKKGLVLNAPPVPMPLIVQADPGKLKQVLLNVIFNAIKFTDNGSITITARVEPRKLPASPVDKAGMQIHEGAGEQQVVISVADTGIGIDPAQQHKLFRPFVMVDGTTTRKFEGTGLGLAISRNLMGLMGGTIELSSAGLDQGTTVELTMPLLNTVPKTDEDMPAAPDQKSGRSPALGSSS